MERTYLGTFLFITTLRTARKARMKTQRHTAISRKVVGKNVRATNPKSNMGYDQYTVPNDCSCRTYFCCFPLALTNLCPWPLVPFFQISLENRADKTTHNTFRDCRVQFFRQPFSKQLYMECDSCWVPNGQNGPARALLTRYLSKTVQQYK